MGIGCTVGWCHRVSAALDQMYSLVRRLKTLEVKHTNWDDVVLLKGLCSSCFRCFCASIHEWMNEWMNVTLTGFCRTWDPPTTESEVLDAGPAGPRLNLINTMISPSPPVHPDGTQTTLTQLQGSKNQISIRDQHDWKSSHCKVTVKKKSFRGFPLCFLVTSPVNTSVSVICLFLCVLGCGSFSFLFSSHCCPSASVFGVTHLPLIWNHPCGPTYWSAHPVILLLIVSGPDL